jgi:lipoate-protein ligase A
MRYLERTLPTIEEDLALDEALLVETEQNDLAPVLRVWEPRRLAVVMGASGRIRDDVRAEACRADGVVIARRSSGGGTVVVGPGTLNVAVVLPIATAPGLEAVDVAQRYVLERLAAALGAAGPAVEVHGSGDLTLGLRKFAGSAQRRLRRHFLVHVTLMYQFPLEWIGRYTTLPRRQPAYRQGRSHDNFLTNLELPRDRIVAAVRAAWLPPGQPAPTAEVPEALIRDLVASKFGDPGWVERF